MGKGFAVVVSLLAPHPSSPCENLCTFALPDSEGSAKYNKDMHHAECDNKYQHDPPVKGGDIDLLVGFDPHKLNNVTTLLLAQVHKSHKFVRIDPIVTAIGVSTNILFIGFDPHCESYKDRKEHNDQQTDYDDRVPIYWVLDYVILDKVLESAFCDGVTPETEHHECDGSRHANVDDVREMLQEQSRFQKYKRINVEPVEGERESNCDDKAASKLSDYCHISKYQAIALVVITLGTAIRRFCEQVSHAGTTCTKERETVRTMLHE